MLRFIRVRIGTKNADEEVGKELRRWRKKWEFTQVQAGKELGVPQETISRIEAGKRQMPVEMYLRIREDFRTVFKKK